MTVHFDLGGDEPCEACGRWVYAFGASLSIEEAISRDSSSEVALYLNDLNTSKERAKLQRFDDIVARFEYFSIYGVLEPKIQLRHLDGEIWEIKTAEDRILFFELAASSRHVRVVRLTNCCKKQKSKTQDGKLPPKHIRKAAAIREIDIHHDPDDSTEVG